MPTISAQSLAATDRTTVIQDKRCFLVTQAFFLYDLSLGRLPVLASRKDEMNGTR
jgi:hypothetical protein